VSAKASGQKTRFILFAFLRGREINKPCFLLGAF
jgi:hypothetical protein